MKAIAPLRGAVAALFSAAAVIGQQDNSPDAKLKREYDSYFPPGKGPENLPWWPREIAQEKKGGGGGVYFLGPYQHYCGTVGTASHKNLPSAAKDLMAQKDPSLVRCKAPAGKCQRVYCRETTGVFLCNDNSHDIDISCWNVGWMAHRLNELCCSDFGEFWVLSGPGGKSGQMFHPSDMYNVIVGYSNCKYENNGPYPVGEGNNSPCLVTHF